MEGIASIVEGPSQAYADILDLLVDLWIVDPLLGAEVASQPWVVGQRQTDDGDRTRSGDRQLLIQILRIASEDVGLATLLVRVPWFLDGVTYSELTVLRLLGDVLVEDAELARLIASFPWFIDESFDGSDTSSALWALIDLAFTDTQLARHIAKLWLAEGLSFYQPYTLQFLSTLAHKDTALAGQIAALPWLVDGITQEESAAVLRLNELADVDITLTRKLVSQAWLSDSGKTSAEHVLSSLGILARSHEELLNELTSQTWFADGIERDEAAFVVTLGQAAADSPDLFTDLLRTHHMQTRTVSLKLAGEVNIWIIQNTPFPPNDDSLTVIEDSARIGEDLLGVPFPTTDIILLLVDTSHVRYRAGGGHFDTHMRLYREKSGDVAFLPHETAHYWFFAPRTGPRWLTEGAAEFVDTYVKHRREGVELSSLIAKNARNASYCTEYYGYENIRHLVDALDNDWERIRSPGCVYHMGQRFLHLVSELAGEETTTSALAELLLSEHGREFDTVEEGIYEVFLKHTPQNRREDFRTLYQKSHGGAAAFGDTEFLDDHGDNAELATPILVGEPAEGLLDYMFDSDFFRFRSQEGKKYHIRIGHDSLRDSSVGLYAPDGETGLNIYWIVRHSVSTGPRIVWIAPDSADYFVAVHNYGGKEGSYTVTIHEAGDAVDDHGDTLAAATDVSTGDTVTGTIEDELDIDYFRFPMDGDKRYRISVTRGTLQMLDYRLRQPDGSLWFRKESTVWSDSPAPLVVPARASGEAFVAINGRGGNIGTYTISITPVDD